MPSGRWRKKRNRYSTPTNRRYNIARQSVHRCRAILLSTIDQRGDATKRLRYDGPMPSFYRSTVGDFLSLSDEQLLAQLSIGYALRGYTSQYTDHTLTWERDIQQLRAALSLCV